jgi:3,2-trans-enoyl-CoA isomerase
VASFTDILLVGISTVTMQRMPVNSMNLELLQELSTIFDTLEKDNSRGMILTSVSGLPCNWLTD